MMHESQIISSAGKSQLDLYLEEPKLEFAYYKDLDILEHWKNHKHRYPALSVMECDVLAILITTVASELAFSIGARVLTKYRSFTLPDNIMKRIQVLKQPRPIKDQIYWRLWMKKERKKMDKNEDIDINYF